MKVVVAIDSLKGSLTSIEAGNAIRDGIKKADSTAEVIVRPLADGGEGTMEALVSGLGGELISLQVQGPLEEKVTAQYGYIIETKTAIIEMAAAAGITLVPHDKRPLDATTYGVGELIKDALGRGCRHFIIGIGGSATNDGGIGMLQALGYEFLDESGKQIPTGAKGLSRIAGISDEKRLAELKNCQFQIACDVNNPLCGMQGATYIYGPQKGVTEEMKKSLDEDMLHYGRFAAEFTRRDFIMAEGAGAAGGLGFAFLTFLNGKLQSGIELVMKAVKLEECMRNADFVVTGEGRLDHQTAMGKGPVGVAKLGKKNGAITIALAGSIAPGAEKCNEEGIDSYFPILTQIVTLDEAMDPDTARKNMERTTEQIFRLILTVKGKI